MKETFRYFVRVNFPEVANDVSNEEIDEIGVLFHKFLDGKLSAEARENILPKNLVSTIMSKDHPLMTNGFHPAYVLHFVQWAKQQSELQPQ